MSGTFSMVPASVASASSASHAWSGGTTISVPPYQLVSNADILAGMIETSSIAIILGIVGKLIITDPSAVGAYLLRMDFDHGSNIISLDGGAAQSYNSLPAGFTLTSASLKIGGRANPTGSTYLQFSALDEALVAPAGAPANPNMWVRNRTFGFPAPTMLDIVNDGIGIRMDMTNAASFAAFYNTRITGTYEIVAYGFSLDTNPPVATGDTITVTSTGTNPATDLILADITSITITYTGGSVSVPAWSISTNNLVLTFALPSIVADHPGIIQINITSTQFSGSVSLGRIATIYFLGAPGAYVLVPNQAYDIYYDFAAGSGATINNKIPNPYVRTAFVP